MIYDVSCAVRLRVQARTAEAAENIVIDMMEQHLEDMLDCPAIIESGIPLTPDNPVARVVNEKEYHEDEEE